MDKSKNFENTIFTLIIRQFDIYNGFMRKTKNSALEVRLNYILASRSLASQDSLRGSRTILKTCNVVKEFLR